MSTIVGTNIEVTNIKYDSDTTSMIISSAGQITAQGEGTATTHQRRCQAAAATREAYADARAHRRQRVAPPPAGVRGFLLEQNRGDDRAREVRRGPALPAHAGQSMAVALALTAGGCLGARAAIYPSAAHSTGPGDHPHQRPRTGDV